MIRSKFLLLGLLCFLLSSCGKTQLDTPSDLTTQIFNSFTNSKPNLYFQSSQNITVEVYYEPGAEPFTGTTKFGKPYWGILEDNLKALFQYRTMAPLISVPKELNAMTAMPAQNKTTWTADDVLHLNAKFKQASPTGSEARFYIYFLNGNASESANVIAFSVNGTPVIGVFKNVITRNGGPVVQKYVEQSTIIHELGHAIGLVNNGIPMKTPHQDEAHGNHTKNSDCVMYWQNEGSADLMNFVSKIMLTGSNVMWGTEVLEDVRLFSK